LADAIVTKQGAAEELRAVTKYEKRRTIKGHGTEARFARVITWAEAKLTGAIVYSFWRKKNCLYVGKGDSWKRLRSYHKSIYLHHANLLKILGITSNSQVGKAECLVKHLYKPRDNKIDPAKTKWSKACPVCKAKKRFGRNSNRFFG